jgi:diguanylate cyclase (GGDEF)-like protein
MLKLRLEYLQKQVAALAARVRMLKNCVRLEDVIGRYGGEEFLLLVPETDCNGTEKLGRRLCDSVRSQTVDGLKEPSGGATTKVSLCQLTTEMLLERG